MGRSSYSLKTLLIYQLLWLSGCGETLELWQQGSPENILPPSVQPDSPPQAPENFYKEPVEAAAPAFTTQASCVATGKPNCIEVSSCGTYTQNDTYFLLMQDVASERECLRFNGKNAVLDLNGFTVTYGNLPFAGVANPGFEQMEGSDPLVPAGWDLSNAPRARRQSHLEKLYFGSYSLRLENVTGDVPAGTPDEEYILSSPVSLPAAGRYAVFTQVAGGPYKSVYATVGVEGLPSPLVCDNKSSGQNREYKSTDMALGIICEFSISAPAVVRAKVTLGKCDPAVISGCDPSVTTQLHVDEVDIRPVGDVGVGFTPYSGATAREIKNGRIVQGQSQAVYSHAYWATSGDRVHGLHLITNGMNSENIRAEWQSNVSVFENYLEANGKLPLNRQFYFAMINASRTSGGLEIYRNLLKNGPHIGILSTDATSRVKNPLKSFIYDNTIRLKTVATNGFAIYAATNTDIYGNLIQPVQGHGIGANPYQNIYGNRIEPRTWPCSEYSSYNYPNSAHGIRMKTYGSGYMSDLVIRDNLIIGRTNPQLSNCFTEVAGITNYITDSAVGTGSELSNIQIYNNTVDVETDDYLQQHAIAYKSGGNVGAAFSIHHNSFKSNHIIVEMSDGDGGGAIDVAFISNSLLKSETPNSAANNGFHALRYGYAETRGMNFIDSLLGPGVDLKDIFNARSSWPNPVGHDVSWNLELQVRDAGGVVSGAVYEARDKANRVVASGATNASGIARLTLREYSYSYSGGASFTAYGPYQIVVSAGGRSAGESLDLRSSRKFVMVLP